MHNFVASQFSILVDCPLWLFIEWIHDHKSCCLGLSFRFVSLLPCLIRFMRCDSFRCFNSWNPYGYSNLPIICFFYRSSNSSSPLCSILLLRSIFFVNPTQFRSVLDECAFQEIRIHPSFFNPRPPLSHIISSIRFFFNSIQLTFHNFCCFCVVIQQLLNQIDVRQHHSTAAISFQT